MNALGINIMVVDDDKDDQFLLQEALSNFFTSFNFEGASDGIECISLLKKGYQPDLIFMDLYMPYKNGLECLRDIQNEQLAMNTPIIIYSRSHHMKDIICASENGARFYLVKPDSFNVLTDLLARIIFLLGRSKREQSSKENFVVRQQNLQAA